MEESASRIIDANLNRASEGARVLEDISRFHISSAALAEEAKSIRHAIRKVPGMLGIEMPCLLQARDSDGDVARVEERSARDGFRDVALANFRRMEEAFRVLEEVAPSKPQLFSELRYKAYSLEKRMIRMVSRRTPDVLGGPCVCVIVTKDLVEDPLEFIREVIKGGAGMIQLREKSLGDKAFVEYALEAREITSGQGVLLIVNDRPDVAFASRADGVHVGQDDLNPEGARKIVGEDSIVGMSTHSEDEVSAACRAGADYIGFGPVFETKTKKRPAASPAALKRAVELSSVPVLAI
ncbi:MAG: thiamine phosphate synthase, partial [Candidatus Hydrogenedentes bacterium]|nr:thiamine phosphate synthase [Candidatus Hydrogenedentota bacterium]